jgi:hypothetical protein
MIERAGDACSRCRMKTESACCTLSFGAAADAQPAASARILPALQDILGKSVRELARIRYADPSSGVSIQTNDRVSQSEEASFSIPKAFLGKLLTHQFELGFSKRDRTGLELRKSLLLIALGISGKESIVTKRVALGEPTLHVWLGYKCIPRKFLRRGDSGSFRQSSNFGDQKS